MSKYDDDWGLPDEGHEYFSLDEMNDMVDEGESGMPIWLPIAAFLVLCIVCYALWSIVVSMNGQWIPGG